MQFDRTVLLDALKTVEPALATRDLVPLLKMVWFTGSAVRATDGTIGIEAPCEADFNGGVPGKVLLGFVESLATEHVTTKRTDTGITFTAGQSKITLPLEPSESSVWPFPASNAPSEGEIDLTADWHEALSFALISTTNNTTSDEQRGVTFEVGGSGKLNLYATDNTTISWVRMDCPDGWECERFTAPGDFIKQVLNLPETGTKFAARQASIEAKAENGVAVYGRLFRVETPIDFAKVVSRHMPEAELVSLPDGLKAALERVELLKDDKTGVRAEFTFTDTDTLVVTATSSLGDFKEELTITEGEHAKLSGRFTPSLLLRGLDGRKDMVVTNKCVVLSGPEHLVYFCAAYAGR